ncbi:MAG: hypothetical protein AAAC48_06245 [Phyllobacterium sp.]|jgi:hypothetical protein|uniref:hypothetical protein n=1 Tax=Phyllobacterium sp. TaxID=1871046 RepID=UPI0030F09293
MAGETALISDVPIADVDLARHRWRSADTASLRGWSGAYPAFACNGYTDLLPLRLCRIPRETTSSAAAVLR